MQIIWDERHGKILIEFLKALNDNKIKYFIIRGFEGLPNHNPSKDVDIMVETGKEKKAALLLKQTYKNNNITNLHSDFFGHIHCYVGMDTVNRLSIHQSKDGVDFLGKRASFYNAPSFGKWRDLLKNIYWYNVWMSKLFFIADTVKVLFRKVKIG